MTALRDELVRLVAWPPARTALAAVVGLVGLTYILLGIAAPRLPASEWPVAEALLAPRAAHASLALVIVAFGGPIAAALAGARGAAAVETRPDRPGQAASAPEAAGVVPAFGAFAILVLAGLLVAYAWGAVALGLGLWLAGREPTVLLDSAAAANVPAILARGWLAAVTLVAIGYAAGILSGHRLSGLAVVGLLFLVEIVTGFVDPAAPLLGVAPISRLADLVGSGSSGEIAPAGLVAGACVAVALGLASAGRRRAAPGRRAG